MQQEEKETKKKATMKIEFLFPGMYNDEYLAIYQAKKNNYKKIQYKIPSTVIDDYERKICRFEDKLTKVALERQSLIREQSRTPNKKEILNKIINQIQIHLQQKEKELFEKTHCDTPVAQLEKKKSQFFQAKQHLQLLETMGYKFVESGVNGMINPKQIHSQPCTPKKLQIRSQSIQHIECQNNKEDNKNQLSERIERIQSKVNQQMARLGLKSVNISPDSILIQKKQQKHNKSTKSQSPLKSEMSQPANQHFDLIAKKPQFSLFKKFQLKLDQEIQKPQDIKGVINYCNTERLDLKNLTKDIQKKKRVQFRKFRIIQKELSTVGELGFEGLKSKYFQ